MIKEQLFTALPSMEHLRRGQVKEANGNYYRAKILQSNIFFIIKLGLANITLIFMISLTCRIGNSRKVNESDLKILNRSHQLELMM